MQSWHCLLKKWQDSALSGVAWCRSIVLLESNLGFTQLYQMQQEAEATGQGVRSPRQLASSTWCPVCVTADLPARGPDALAGVCDSSCVCKRLHLRRPFLSAGAQKSAC